MRLGDLPPNFDIPTGFRVATSHGGFTNHNGPVFEAMADGDLRSGLFVLQRHCNGMGFLHGGMIGAFADRSLAVAVYSATQRMSVTLKLTLQYYETVRLGDWFEAHPRVHSVHNDLVQVSADLLIDGQRLAARADATFRLLRRVQKQA